jgi:hypothetical protein
MRLLLRLVKPLKPRKADGRCVTDKSFACMLHEEEAENAAQSPGMHWSRHVTNTGWVLEKSV